MFRVVSPAQGEEARVFIHPNSHPSLIEGYRGGGVRLNPQHSLLLVLAQWASVARESLLQAASCHCWKLDILGPTCKGMVKWGPHSICCKGPKLIRRSHICHLRSELGLDQDAKPKSRAGAGSPWRWGVSRK